MKKSPKKLALRTESIRTLDLSDLGRVAGGDIPQSMDDTMTRCTGCSYVCSNGTGCSALTACGSCYWACG